MARRMLHTCSQVWLCGTEDKTDICYRHYHTCWRTAGHRGACESGSGPGHTSECRHGDIVASTTEAYAQMTELGWRSR